MIIHKWKLYFYKGSKGHFKYYVARSGHTYIKNMSKKGQTEQ